jgi:fructosamine-3-kinase
VSDARTVQAAAAAALGSTVTELRPIAGGDLNDAYAARLADGRRVFIKTSPDAAPGGFAAEAAGLRWIAAADGAPAVPDVLAVLDPPGSASEPRLLVLSWIDRGRLDRRGEEALGRGLAAMHRAGAGAHGAAAPGGPDGLRIGPLSLPAGTTPTWSEAYAELRLLPLARRAADRGALAPDGLAAVERVCERLPELAGPPEPPARLHGDLWGGNVLADLTGTPHLIDPAAYGGHREIDLAMLRLFGGPGERCFAAYDEAYPLADGHRDRVALWQLLPLLVHAVLFGATYGERAAAVARRYVGSSR